MPSRILPVSIHSYVRENYPDSQIVEAEKEIEKGKVYYEVELSNGYELEFDEMGKFLEAEHEGKDDNED